MRYPDRLLVVDSTSYLHQSLLGEIIKYHTDLIVLRIGELESPKGVANLISSTPSEIIEALCIDDHIRLLNSLNQRTDARGRIDKEDFTRARDKLYRCTPLDQKFLEVEKRLQVELFEMLVKNGMIPVGIDASWAALPLDGKLKYLSVLAHQHARTFGFPIPTITICNSLNLAYGGRAGADEIKNRQKLCLLE